MSQNVPNLNTPSLEVCLGQCAVEKQMIVPLSINQMGWRIAAECWCGGVP
jgi:hypothetical protein